MVYVSMESEGPDVRIRHVVVVVPYVNMEDIDTIVETRYVVVVVACVNITDENKIAATRRAPVDLCISVSMVFRNAFVEILNVREGQNIAIAILHNRNTNVKIVIRLDILRIVQDVQ